MSPIFNRAVSESVKATDVAFATIGTALSGPLL
jgi:hypothetical protein